MTRILPTDERRLWFVVALLLALVLALFAAVRLGGPLPGELRFSDWLLVGGENRFVFDQTVTLPSYLGNRWTALGTVVAFALVALEERGGRTAVLFLAAGAGALASKAGAHVLGPTSPEYDGAAGVYISAGPNFPSTHTVFAVTVYGLAALLVARAGHRALAAILVVPVVTMGPSLALLGNHYPADVLAGYAFGAAWLVGVVIAARRLGVLTSP